jgi:hypothetical protein
LVAFSLEEVPAGVISLCAAALVLSAAVSSIGVGLVSIQEVEEILIDATPLLFRLSLAALVFLGGCGRRVSNLPSLDIAGAASLPGASSSCRFSDLAVVLHGCLDVWIWVSARATRR